MVRENGQGWQRSCTLPRHNKVSRGERELRGERRGKGGRSLLATAAPFFFVLVSSPGAGWGQVISAHVRGGFTQSTPLVRDAVATPALAQLLGSPVDEEVRVTAEPGVTGGAGVRVSFWRTVGLTAEGEWTRTQLRAEDSGGERTMQDLNVVHTSVGLMWAVRPWVELGAGAGLIWYRAEEAGLFADGSDTSPTVEVRVAWVPPVLSGRLALLGTAHTHRFGTRAIRDAGGIDGDVGRVSIGARFRLVEVGL